MYFLKKLDSAILLLLSLLIGSCGAQIKNKKNEKVTVYGNCRMCEKKIEVAGNIKGIVKVEWEKDTKQATLIYDSKKTNTDEILKRIALSGYDSDKFIAPDEVYDKLHGCCHYERVIKQSNIN